MQMDYFKKSMQNKYGKTKEEFDMSKKEFTPSPEVDQKQLLNDKVDKLRENNFEDNHVRKVTQNGAQGQ